MKIVIACGGSGGHLFPALSLATSLQEKRKDVTILFVISQKPLDLRILGKKEFVLVLPVVGMPPLLSLQFPLFLIKFLVSVWISLFRMLRFRPDGFIGFGGYVSGPVLLVGFLLRKPTLIVEENFIPGRANLWLSRWASRVSVAFQETQKFFQGHRDVVCVGNPFRQDLSFLPSSQARRSFGLAEDRFTILLTGGSQGAHRLNEAMVGAIEKMPSSEKSDLQVIHLAGDRDAGWIEKQYKSLGISARVFSFLEEMGKAYSAADLVIARGGAMTLTEVGHFRKAALFVPLTLARTHQVENVRYLASQGACLFFDEEKAMTEEFAHEILNLKKDLMRRNRLSEKLASFYPDGTNECLAEEILTLAEGSQ